MSSKQSGQRELAAGQCHVCPAWLGAVFASPLRRLLESPERLLHPVIREGQTVLEVGPGMGFYSIPAARRVGGAGRLICVELQQAMIAGLEKRLRRAGLGERVEVRACTADDLGLADLVHSVDVALILNVLHESPEPRRMLGQLAGALRLGGTLLLVEPRGHCSVEFFDEEIRWAGEAGLTVASSAKRYGRYQRRVLLRKTEEATP